MATWHQLRRPVTLYHETKWTVVVDPPNQLRTLMLFDHEQQANDYARTQQHAYVLRPARQEV